MTGSKLSNCLKLTGLFLLAGLFGVSNSLAGTVLSSFCPEEDRLVRLALERDPALAAARSELDAARARRRAALSPDDPELRVGLGRNHRGRAGGATETYEDYEIGLRFFPPNLWQRSALRDRADAELEIARARLALLEHRAAREVRADYFRLRELKSDLEFTARQEEIRAERQSIVRELAEAGRATSPEVARAASRWLEARQAGEEIRRETGRLRRRLEARTGLDDLGAVSPRPRPEIDRSEEWRLTEMPEPDHPEVEVRRWRLRAADAEHRLARGESAPWLNHLQVAYGDDDRPGRNDAWSAQAAVSVPLFSLLYRPQREEAAGKLAARARLREINLTLETEAAQARADWLAALDSHRETAEVCRPLAREIRENLELLEADPEIERLAVLNLEDSLLETERVLTRSAFEVERTRRALEDALGIAPRGDEDG